jgi:hypothetical protein
MRGEVKNHCTYIHSVLHGLPYAVVLKSTIQTANTQFIMTLCIISGFWKVYFRVCPIVFFFSSCITAMKPNRLYRIIAEETEATLNTNSNPARNSFHDCPPAIAQRSLKDEGGDTRQHLLFRCPNENLLYRRQRTEKMKEISTNKGDMICIPTF